jgi:ABC-type branched-subunit amino acid transport system permease subunit
MNPDIERQWKARLEELGPDVVRVKLDAFAIGASADGKVHGIVAYTNGDSEPLTANREFCEAWLAEKDRDARRHTAQLWWMTAVGAVAAVVAAIASVFGLWAK